jgi:diaminopimelate decarboxylase
MLLGTQRVNERGHLEIGGCDAVDLARRFGTPLYVMDEEEIRKSCREYLGAFRARYPRAEVSYAGKAFLCKAICPIIEQEGLHLDVASGGELFTALAAGFPPERIALHGNNKSPEELKMAVDARVGRIIVDNLYELDLLDRIAAEAPGRIPLSVRVKPGIDPHTHRRIRTGQADSKFGLGIDDGAALAAIRRILANPKYTFRGVHCHVGSQLLDVETHVEKAQIMVEFLRTVRDATGAAVEELNIGGGLGIRYLAEHEPPALSTLADAVISALTAALDRHGLGRPVLAQEPGRALVGEAGTTLYTIGAIKEIPAIRTYVAIDGGMSDNPRPQLYDAVYEAIVANRAAQPADFVATIAGKHCETDTLISDVKIARPEPGDILAVPSTGAYNYAMASNYNRFTRPAVVLVNEGTADVIVRRETYLEVAARDEVPERFRAQAG